MGLPIERQYQENHDIPSRMAYHINRHGIIFLVKLPLEINRTDRLQHKRWAEHQDRQCCHGEGFEGWRCHLFLPIIHLY